MKRTADINAGGKAYRSKPAASGAIPEASSPPSMDAWLREAKRDPSAGKIGMYLVHNGTVRATPRAQVREGASGLPPVDALELSCDREKLAAAVADTYRMEGIFYIRTWVNSGRLSVGDDMMYVLVGGDIRPHVVDALQHLVGRIKTECVSEREIYGTV